LNDLVLFFCFWDFVLGELPSPRFFFPLLFFSFSFSPFLSLLFRSFTSTQVIPFEAGPTT